MFLVVAVSLWLFAAIAGVVMDGDSLQFDRWLLNALREPGEIANPVGPVWLEEAVRDLTALGGTAVLTLFVLAVSGLLLLERRPRTVGFLLFAVIGGLVLSMALKYGFDRPRPDFLPHGQRVLTTSFPSAHSMNSAVVYLTLAAIMACSVKRRAVRVYLVATAVLLTVLVGFSRVYLGVHWPTDVLAGWSAGAGWAVFCWLLMQAMQARQLVEPEQDEATGGPGS
ncbi:MAG: phosphatase PAP2 family protein [Gammaproteobacteria bacterium]|nr:phosphatase PAP2 family protein [Gammaproteobacteria bacterium]